MAASRGRRRAARQCYDALPRGDRRAIARSAAIGRRRIGSRGGAETRPERRSIASRSSPLTMRCNPRFSIGAPPLKITRQHPLVDRLQPSGPQALVKPVGRVDDPSGDLVQDHCRRHGSAPSALPRTQRFARWRRYGARLGRDPAAVRRGGQMRSPYMSLPLPLAKRHAQRYTPEVSTEAFSGGI